MDDGLTTIEEEIERAQNEAHNWPEETSILEANYYVEPGFEFLMMKLSDGRRVLVPREELGELKDATVEQAKDLVILSPGAAIWWPQLEDGLYLADFLEHRWGKAAVAA